MSLDPPSSTDSLSVEAQERIAEELIHFSRALKNGENPSIETFLEGFAGAERAEFLREMILCEYSHQGHTDELTTFETYRERFPDDIAVVAEAEKLFRDAQTIIEGKTPVPAPPQRLRYLGEYELLEEIARGGMGVVYKAKQIPLKRTVALKMILSGHLATPEDIKRFRQEARMAARLKHPNIVPVHEVGEFEGHHYLTMDLINGQSLAGTLREETLPAKKAAGIVKTLAEAVQYAHANNIVHRDLKPANVILDEKGQPHITDFGLAKITEREDEDSTGALTHTRQILGTAAYMSPEQAAGQHNLVGPLSDIYSLGAVLYACLTGRGPHLGDSTYETLQQVIKHEPLSPRLLNPSVPKDLETICLKCLQKEPHKRYGTPEDLAEDLGRFLKGLPVKARPVGRITKTIRWCRRNTAVAVLLLVVVVSLLSGTSVSTYFAFKANDRALAEADARKDADEARREAEADQKVAEQAQSRAELAKQQAIAERQKTEAEKKKAQAAQLQAEEKSAESLDRLVRLNVANGVAQLEQGDLLRALPWFTKALKEERGDPARERPHRVRLTAMLQQAPQLKQVWFFDKYMTAHHAEFSPDGRRVLISIGMPNYISGHRGEARVWDAETGEPVTSPLRHEHSHPVRYAKFSPDGRLVVTAGGGYVPAGARTVRGTGEARVWDATTGKPITPPLTSAGELKVAQFSSDGSLVLVAGGSAYSIGQSQVWNARTGEAVGEPVNHARGHSIAFSPDGKRIALGSWMEARILDAATGEPVTPVLTHAFKKFRGGGGGKGAVGYVGFSPDGGRVVTASDDETARVWDAATGKPITPLLQHSGNVNHASFSADGKLLATASDDETVRVWDTETGELALAPIRHSGPVTHVWFSPDGKSIATISGTKPLRASDNNCYHLVRVWSVKTGLPLTPPLRHGARVTWASFSPDSRRLLTASADRTVRLWEFAPEAQTKLAFNTEGRASHGAISPDASRVVTKSYNQNARLWNLATGQSIPLSDKLSGYVQYLAFSPDGKRVLVANGSSPWGPFSGSLGMEKVTFTDEKQARVYDAATGQPVSPPLSHNGHVLHAAFSSDGLRLVTASYDHTARVWDVLTGKPISPPLKHGDSVYYASFSPDGRHVLVTGYNRAAGLWNIQTGVSASPIIKHGADLLDVTYVENECLILVAQDEVARVWNVTAGRPVTSLLKHFGNVNTGAFSRDGRLVATASDDGTARVWDAATGEPMTPPLVHGRPRPGTAEGPYGHSDLPQIDFAPDGSLIVASWDGIYTWNLNPDLRSVDELILQSQILSGSAIDGSSALVPVDTDTLRAAWERQSK